MALWVVAIGPDAAQRVAVAVLQMLWGLEEEDDAAVRDSSNADDDSPPGEPWSAGAMDVTLVSAESLWVDRQAAEEKEGAEGESVADSSEGGEGPGLPCRRAVASDGALEFLLAVVAGALLSYDTSIRLMTLMGDPKRSAESETPPTLDELASELVEPSKTDSNESPAPATQTEEQ
eukprot:scaffold71447_cov17-Prasinocladus_malaysianus.AAC.2